MFLLSRGRGEKKSPTERVNFAPSERRGMERKREPDLLLKGGDPSDALVGRRGGGGKKKKQTRLNFQPERGRSNLLFVRGDLNIGGSGGINYNLSEKECRLQRRGNKGRSGTHIF